MSEKQEKKWSEIVKEERDKGNVVYLCIDEVLSAPVKEIIKQPAEGLLWDLNRDEVTALTLMDKEGMIHWVNNFAVARVIKELKRQLDDALVENAALKRENEALRLAAIRYLRNSSAKAGAMNLYNELDALLKEPE